MPENGYVFGQTNTTNIGAAPFLRILDKETQSPLFQFRGPNRAYSYSCSGLVPVYKGQVIMVSAAADDPSGTIGNSAVYIVLYFY